MSAAGLVQGRRHSGRFVAHEGDPIAALYPVEYGQSGRGQTGNRFGLAGIAEFEAVDLIAMPDLCWCLQNSNGFTSPKDMELVQQKAVEQCEEHGNRFAILDFPPGTNPTGAMQWRRLFDSSYAVFY